MELRPGALIAGRYRVERKVGSGGMGEVWSGEHVAIGLRVALKTLLPAAACDHQIVARFKREAYLLGRVRSEHAARVVDFVSDRHHGLVLVMEFVEGESLGAAIQARRLGVEEALDLGIDLVSGLCDLHGAQVVHRDLKPDNVILRPLADGQKRAMIVDFGVGRLLAGGEASEEEEITSITHADMAVGTIAYMAPEQLLSSREVTGAADLYAVGAILFRAVSGKHVFGEVDDVDYLKQKLGAEPAVLELSRFDRVAKGLQAIVARALARSPSARFESAQAMRRELIALRDLARSVALDLDGATEEAPASTLLFGLEAAPTGPTTKTGPPEIDEEPTTSRAIAELSPPPPPSLPAPLPPAIDDEPPPPSAAAPVPAAPSTPPAAPALPTKPAPRRGAAIAIAFLAGAVIGYLAHLLAGGYLAHLLAHLLARAHVR